MPVDLKTLRTQIRETDEAILQLVAKRQQLAKHVGEYKLAQNLPVKDYGVEKQVIENARRRAKELGFYEDLAEEVLGSLIRFSCLVQDEYQTTSRRTTSGSQKQILVVGGAGPMGRWLAQFFESFGHNVVIRDITSPESLGEQVAQAEVIALATPIGATPAILEGILKTGTKALVFDICSLKSPLLGVMKRATAAGLRFTSIHPMFGPNVEMLSGRNILICDAGNAAATEDVAKLFRESTAKLVALPLDHHDEAMAFILGGSHLANLVFTRALTKSGKTFAELSTIGSTTFDAQIKVAKVVAAENPDLYYEIQAENTHASALLQAMEGALAEFQDAITTRDREAFKELMGQGNVYFEGRDR